MVERFQMKTEHDWICARPDDKGDWVRHSDYSALEDRFVARIEDYEATIARLQEQVETLRKERDGLIKAVADHVTVRGEYFARAEAAEAERDRLREALRETDCPRPCNGRPDDFSAGDCFDAGECGCGVRAALQKEPQP